MRLKKGLPILVALNVASIGAAGGGQPGPQAATLQNVQLAAPSAGVEFPALAGVPHRQSFKVTPEQLAALRDALRGIPTGDDLSVGVSGALSEAIAKEFGNLRKRQERVYRVYDSPEIVGIENPKLAAQKLGVALPAWAVADEQLARAWLQSRTRPMLQVFPDRLSDIDKMVAVGSDSSGNPLPPLKDKLRELDAPLRSAAASVFRIEREGFPVSIIGTATHVGDGCLLTVEHVAHQIRLAKSAGSRVFATATTVPEPSRLEVTGVAYPLMTSEYPPRGEDFAIIQAGGNGKINDYSVASPSSVMGKRQASKHTMVATIGHPVPSREFGDPDAPFMSYFALLFGGQPGNLRVSPGLWLGDRSSPHLHDAACFQGNSGGPVIELSSLRWIGMHVGPGPFNAGGNEFIRFDQLNAADLTALNALLTRLGKPPIEPAP